METLINPWTVAIFGGILSGIIVKFLTSRLFSKKENRELYQTIMTANHEILFAIRPAISEGDIPDQNVLDSVISATAKKYNIDPQDLHSPKDISDELIKEVMDSSFISNSTKNEFCDKLLKLKLEITESKRRKEIESYAHYRKKAKDEYEQRMRKTLSRTLGLVTTMTTMLMAILLFSFDRYSILFDSELLTIGVLPILSTVVALVAAVTATFHSSKRRSSLKTKGEEQISTKSQEDNSE